MSPEVASTPKRSILFVPWVDIGPKTSERSPRLLQMLSERYDVVTMPRGRLNKMVYDPLVPKMLRYLLFPLDTLSSVLTCVISMKRNQTQLVFGEGTYYSLVGLMAARIREVPCIWDNHGNIWTMVKTQGKSTLFLRANEVLEGWLFKRVSLLVVVSEQERNAYQGHGFDPAKISVLPTCVDLASSAIKDRKALRESFGMKEGEKAVLFFAMLGYGPNREAAEYIATVLAPAVREISPDVVFYIAGGGGKVQESDGVRALGFVDDLDGLMSAADFCIAPIWRGVGILTKVLDMMASGKPTVVSALAKEGIPELVSGSNCYIAEDRDAFINAVKALVGREDLAADVGMKGRRLVEESYSCSVMRSKLNEIVDRTIDQERIRS